MRGKILVFSLVIAALSIGQSSLTMAYLMETESLVNTFTAGQVKIKTLTTSIGRDPTTSDADIETSAATYSTYLSNNCVAMQADDTCNKYVFVKNTGVSDAYVRVRILLPKSSVSETSPEITLEKTASNEFYESSNSNVICDLDETGCVEYVFTRISPLVAGTMTQHSVIDGITYNTVLNESLEGENVESETLDLTNKIKVITEAIQAQGFNTVAEAFSNY